MNLIIIAAVGKNGELGKNGQLIWKIPHDLACFKKITMGKTMVMGKNTFNSLPKLLPGRKHIILSKSGAFNKEIEDSLVFDDKEELIKYITTELKDEDVYIIGGASIYEEFIDLCNLMYITEIDDTDESADAYFPKLNSEDWNSHWICMYKHNDVNVKHMKYVRKNK